MSVAKYTHTVNIVTSTSLVAAHLLEFGVDFIEWLDDIWPGVQDYTKNVEDFTVNAYRRYWIPITGVSQAAGTNNSIRLASGASSVDDFYNGQQITITAGPGLGDVRTIIDYVGSTRSAVVSEDFSATPTTASNYSIEETWVPRWLKDAFPQAAASYRYVAGAITWTDEASSTDWCICACKDQTGSSALMSNIIIGVRYANGNVIYGEIARYQIASSTSYLNQGEQLVLLIADKTGEYFIFSKDANPDATGGNVYYYGMVRLDNPVAVTDLEAFIVFGQNNIALTKFSTVFGVEAISNTVRMVTDTLILESDAFDKNVYMNKVPLARVWGGTQQYGLRGWTSHLAVVPQSYLISQQLYEIGEDLYYGLNLFDGHVVLPGGVIGVGQRVLLKV